MRSCLFLCLAVAGPWLLVASVQAAPPQWIWSTPDAATKAEPGSVYFRKSFNVAEPESGELEISADNSYEVFVNGRNVGSGEGWSQRTKYKIGPLLTPGRNLIAVHAKNAGPDPAGLMVRATIKSKGKPAEEIVSDASWKFATKVGGRWAVLDFSDEKWSKASALGEYGKSGPWGPAGKLVEAADNIVPVGTRSQEKGHFQLRDGDRVVLLGGTFIERLQNDGYFEAALTAALPQKHITYRNLGWSGDTVWGDSRGVFGGRAEGFKRLVSDVTLCKPTVIVVCYGQNEAYAGEEGLADFEQGLNALLDALEPTGARFLLLGPPPRFNVGPPLPDPAKYNEDLRRYVEIVRSTAKDRSHAFFNLAPEFEQILARAEGDKVRTKATIDTLTENGVHLNPYGNIVVSRCFRRWLFGATDGNWYVDIDAATRSIDTISATVEELTVSEDAVSVLVADRTIPDFNSTDQLGTLSVRGLKPGKYQLLIDGEAPKGWENGRSFETGDIKWLIHRAKASALALKLNDVVNQKNELFFHRYRPQNETYLFLFRKHEQGNNAVEIPMFDPLIEEKEKQIAQLRQPLKQKIELRRVSE